MRRLGPTAAGISVTFAAQLSTVAVALGLSVVLARTIGPEGTGTLQVVQTLGNQLALLFSLGASISVIRFVATREERPDAVAGACIVLAACMTPLVVLLAVGAPSLATVLLKDQAHAGGLVAAACPLTVLFIVQDLVVAIHIGRG